MYMLMMLIKKRPDLSMAQFMDYYDNHHIHFMHGLFAKGAAVHRRNFIVGRDASTPVRTAMSSWKCSTKTWPRHRPLPNNSRTLSCGGACRRTKTASSKSPGQPRV
jgi:hypothetical protein